VVCDAPGCFSKVSTKQSKAPVISAALSALLNPGFWLLTPELITDDFSAQPASDGCVSYWLVLACPKAMGWLRGRCRHEPAGEDDQQTSAEPGRQTRTALRWALLQLLDSIFVSRAWRRPIFFALLLSCYLGQ
jgi:hypothetical protein